MFRRAGAFYVGIAGQYLGTPKAFSQPAPTAALNTGVYADDRYVATVR